MQDRHPEIDRVDVGLRLLFTLLFAIALSLVRTISALLAAFQLIYSFVTQKLPPRRTREFGNALATYGYRLQRYVLHADGARPFPFEDWPEAREPLRTPYPPAEPSAEPTAAPSG